MPPLIWVDFMAKTACMICGKSKDGIEIAEDHVIRAMRWFKTNITKDAKGYRIVVCKDCMADYKKKRAKFTRRRLMYVGLGVIFTLSLLFVSQGRILGVLVYGFAAIVFMYLLSLVSYMPALKQTAKSRK